MNFDKHTELQLLEALEEKPETSQADLAAQVGVAVGTVNWYLKRWTKKGYVIINRMDRWRWRYLLTPKGVAEKTALAKAYVEASMSIYRMARAEAQDLLGQVREAGYDVVAISGDGDLVDICQLTCLELGLRSFLTMGEIDNDSNSLPRLVVEGVGIVLVLPSVESATKPEPSRQSAIDQATFEIES